MRTVYLLSVWLHLLGAMAWVGGMIFLVAVVVPMLRKPEMKDRATELLRVSGNRFRTVGWIALTTLVVTGFFNVFYRGFSLGQIVDGTAFQGQWGHTLAMKLATVSVILVMSAVHDFWVGPTATRDPDPARREKFRKGASVFGRVNFILSLVVVALAITLVR